MNELRSTMIELYDRNAFECSKVTAQNYSTSFSFGIRLFHEKYRPAIYAIYGYVRFADEIVDTFHNQRQEKLIREFRKRTYQAIENGFSSNPILHSFQKVVNENCIDFQFIEAFLDSMEMDLTNNEYSREELQKYIYGSAEVVGLMCLRVFYQHRHKEFDELVHPARKLGEAFQKVNFLRDIRADYMGRGRVYFPDIDIENFTEEQKRKVEKEIAADFAEAKVGVKKLHKDVQMGVYMAYIYYLELLKRIRRTTPENIMNKRYRVSNFKKLMLFISSWIRFKLGKI